MKDARQAMIDHLKANALRAATIIEAGEVRNAQHEAELLATIREALSWL